VQKIYSRLIAAGVDAWLDKVSLLPGQDWKLEIRKAVRRSDVVLVCLSKESVNRAGFLQKEIKDALDVADEQPEGAIFIIPVKLQECDVPERLCQWQWVNLFEAGGFEKLTRSLQARADALGLRLSSTSVSKKKRLPVNILGLVVAIGIVVVGIIVIALSSTSKNSPPPVLPTTTAEMKSPKVQTPIVVTSSPTHTVYQLDVDALSGWIDSGIDLLKDQYVQMTASGLWSNGRYEINGILKTPVYDADGLDPKEYNFETNYNYLLNDGVTRVGALIGKVGGEGRPFRVGVNYPRTLVGKSGRLYLAMNDDPIALEDNNGYVTVQVQVFQ
jgi:hypothetical protein